MKDKLTICTKYMLDVMFFGGIIVTICVPFIIHFYGNYNSYFADNLIPLSILFIISGILAVLIIFELRCMFQSVLEDDCFTMANVKSLNRMGTYSLLIVPLSAGRLFLYITPSVVIVALVFLIAGLFSKVLSHVFDKAVHYKLENDLTI